jgi:hypothetical protein
MENQGVESFYSKPVFVIAENREHLKMEINVAEKDKKHTAVELRFVNVNDIAEIHLTNSTAKTDGINLMINSKCIIEIITKTGLFYDRRLRFHFKSLMPLGYAVPAEFYSPKYDTPEALQNDNPDLRSTIYWKPNIVIDSDNKASVDFYTADKDTPYSVGTEGVCADGRLIYRRKKELINIE